MKKDKLVYIAFGIYVVILLWFTLFNRESASTVRVIFPFQSYVGLFSGEIGNLKEIIGNILIFIPVGYFAKTFFKKNCIKTVLIGFGFSLIIELIQLVTRLGCFEFDDLLHNSLGTLIGYFIYKKIPLSISINFKKLVGWTGLGLVLTSIVLFSIVKISNYATEQRMISFAALSDTQDQKNLLVLNGDEGYLHGQKVCLTYQDDGQIKVSGISEDGEWLRIGELTLEPGDYVFGGLSGESNEKISLVLQYYNEDKEDFLNLTSYIGTDENTEFSLEKVTKIRAYIRIYAGYDCDILVRPIIYKQYWQNSLKSSIIYYNYVVICSLFKKG